MLFQSTLCALLKLCTINSVYIYKSVGQTEYGLDHGSVKHGLNSVEIIGPVGFMSKTKFCTFITLYVNFYAVECVTST